jgi:lysophospholipase L1-like esterase
MRLALFMSLFVAAVTFAEPSIKPTPPSSQPTKQADAALPVEIKPDDAKLYYVGRWDTRDAKGPRAQWAVSSVTVRFNGTDLQARINDEKKGGYLTVTVDGEVTTVILPAAKAGLFDLARGLPAGEHTVTLTRRTEPTTGTTQVMGFYLNEGATLLEPKRLTRRIEIIGDSISCGYGNDVLDPKLHYSPQTQNGYATYGAVAARELNAELHCAAWSGRKVTNALEIYQLTLPLDKRSTWTPGDWKADVVLINLCTNDFNAKEVPDEEKWVAAYKELIATARKNNPDAQIYLSSGPMFTIGKEGKGLTFQNYLNRVQKEVEEAGEKKIKQLHFARQDAKADGVGADWHPSAATNAKMAQKLVEQIKVDLKW